MAKEATVTVSLGFAKGSVVQNTRSSGASAVDVSGTAYHQNVQSVATSAAALNLGGVGSVGYCMLHNLDPTNYVQVFPTAAADEAFLRLKPNEYALFRFDSGAVPYVKANTATCLLEVYLLSD